MWAGLAVVQRLYPAIDRVLRPIVADEERRAGARLVAPGREIRARDQQGLRALNDALRSAFDSPGPPPVAPGGAPTEAPPLETPERRFNGAGRAEHEPPPPPEPPALAMRFKQSPLRLHPGERRGTSLLFDPCQVPPGTPVSVEADPGLRIRLSGETVPDPGARPWTRLAVDLRARASVEPGSRLSVLAEAGEEAAELEVVVARHTGSGCVREIARKDEDAPLEAQFDPESGVVTVYEGRREFRSLERAARRGGIGARRVREYLPYRMLEVEVAANAVYQWAAERIVKRRQAELGRTTGSADYARAVHLEAQALRHRSHERLMRAFLDPEVFDGRVRIEPERQRRRSRQESLPDPGGGRQVERLRAAQVRIPVPMIAATSAAVATIPSLRIADTSLRSSLRSSRISVRSSRTSRSRRSRLLSSRSTRSFNRASVHSVLGSILPHSADRTNGTTSCEECPARSSPHRSAAVGRRSTIRKQAACPRER